MGTDHDGAAPAELPAGGPVTAVSLRWQRQLRAGVNYEKRRLANRRYYARKRAERQPRPPAMSAAHDIRTLVYLPPPGVIALSLLGVLR